MASIKVDGATFNGIQQELQSWESTLKKSGISRKFSFAQYNARLKGDLNWWISSERQLVLCLDHVPLKITTDFNGCYEDD